MSVEEISKHTLCARHCTVKKCLEDCLREVEEGGQYEHATKAIVIFLDDRDNKYKFGWYQAGMSMSGCISLVEVAKMTFLEHMDLL